MNREIAIELFQIGLDDFVYQLLRVADFIAFTLGSFARNLSPPRFSNPGSAGARPTVSLAIGQAADKQGPG